MLCPAQRSNTLPLPASLIPVEASRQGCCAEGIACHCQHVSQPPVALVPIVAAAVGRRAWGKFRRVRRARRAASRIRCAYRRILVRRRAGSDDDSVEELDESSVYAEIESEFKSSITEEVTERSRAFDTALDAIVARGPALAERPSVKPGSGLAAPSVLPRVVVCGLGDIDNNEVGRRLVERLREGTVGDALSEPLWVNLFDVPDVPIGELDVLLARCRAAVVCPDVTDDDRRRLLALRMGLRSLIECFPDPLSRVVLLSRVGAQDGKGGFNIGGFFGMSSAGSFAGLEDELTVTARRRSARNPLRVFVVRAELPPGTLRPGATLRPRCWPSEDRWAGSSGFTTHATAAEALFQALSLDIDAGFSVEDCYTEDPRTPRWPELLLPFVGPEVWRRDVADARRAALFVQGWAAENFSEAARASSLGIRTPLETRCTPAGIVFKFRPVGTPSGITFEELEQGGLEFLAETPASGNPRLRVRRCAYGWKVLVRLNSERALLRKFKDDWGGATGSISFG